MTRRPSHVNPEFTATIRRLAAEHNMEIPDGFTLWGVNTGRGRCSYNGNITVPAWTEDHYHGLMLQYIAHEIAHAWAYKSHGTWAHNAVFMEYMMILCPAEHWHYELGYKPRAAAAAGITRPSTST